MLPKSLRLQGRGDFEAVFRTRKAVFGPEIGLFFRPTTYIGPRIGFSFKQRVFPRAVTRNFLKRKGSAIMRELVPLLPENTDMVILFHRPFRQPVDYSFLKTSLTDLIKRLNKEKK